MDHGLGLSVHGPLEQGSRPKGETITEQDQLAEQDRDPSEWTGTQESRQKEFPGGGEVGVISYSRKWILCLE